MKEHAEEWAEAPHAWYHRGEEAEEHHRSETDRSYRERRGGDEKESMRKPTKEKGLLTRIRG